MPVGSCTLTEKKVVNTTTLLQLYVLLIALGKHQVLFDICLWSGHHVGSKNWTTYCSTVVLSSCKRCQPVTQLSWIPVVVPNLFSPTDELKNFLIFNTAMKHDLVKYSFGRDPIQKSVSNWSLCHFFFVHLPTTFHALSIGKHRFSGCSLV